jgi:hypothetical protein
MVSLSTFQIAAISAERASTSFWGRWRRTDAARSGPRETRVMAAFWRPRRLATAVLPWSSSSVLATF